MLNSQETHLIETSYDKVEIKEKSHFSNRKILLKAGVFR